MEVSKPKTYYVVLRYVYRARRMVPAVGVSEDQDMEPEVRFGHDYLSNENILALFRVMGAKSVTEAQGFVTHCLLESGASTLGSMWMPIEGISVRRLK